MAVPSGYINIRDVNRPCNDICIIIDRIICVQQTEKGIRVCLEDDYQIESETSYDEFIDNMDKLISKAKIS